MSGPLVISTRSWHYRMIKFFCIPWPGKWGTASEAEARKGMPKSLCGYFWYVVLHIVYVVPVLCVLLGTVFLLSFPARWLCFGVRALWRLRPEKTQAVEKERPGLVWQYIRAKKRRVCPLIEFKSEPPS